MSKLTDRLKILGIFNPIHFAERSGAAAWVTYHTSHAHWIGQTDRRAVAYYRRDGKIYHREFREYGDTAADTRRLSVQAAQEYAAGRAGITIEWARSPWPTCWLPKDSKDNVMAALEAAEKAQEARS